MGGILRFEPNQPRGLVSWQNWRDLELLSQYDKIKTMSEIEKRVTPQQAAAEKYFKEMPFIKHMAVEDDFYKLLRGEKVEGIQLGIDDFYQWATEFGPLSMETIIETHEASMGGNGSKGVEFLLVQESIASARGRVSLSYTMFEMQRKSRG